MLKKTQIVIIILLLPVLLFSQKTKVPFLNIKTPWADSVYKTLSSEERIAQLLHVAAYSNRDSNHVKEIARLIQKYKIGGLIFFQGGPVRQANQTNYYQSISKVPLMISIDAEWGLKMRLDSTIKFPFQMALGAIKNDSLIYKMGREIGKQCVRLGIHVNFAPVADVNNNPNNPVINYRSFGENKYKVANKSMMYMQGMQDEFILANAKHFPGHGDTDFDSHKSLPIINHSIKRLDTLELYPFKKLINKGVASIMVAHLNIPSLDSTPNLASTLSKPIVTGLLKNKLGFKGIAFTDALNMKGVAKYYEPGQVDVKALIAGNDALLFSEDVPKAIDEIKKTIKKGLISQKEVDSRCYKQLKAKEWAGLSKLLPIQTKTIISDLNNYEAQLLNRNLVEASLTILRNQNEILPVKDLLNTKIASLSIGAGSITNFQQRLSDYTKVNNYFMQKTVTDSTFDNIKKSLDNYDLIICSLHELNMKPSKSFGITKQMAKMVNYLSEQKNTVIVIFGNAYSLREFKKVHLSKGVIMAYQQSYNTQDLSAQLIFGGIGAKATLPVTVNEHFKEGDGLKTKGGIRFKYTLPEEVRMNSDFIQSKIDSIVSLSMKEGAFPGVQVLAAKDGKIFFHKAYGYHTYDSIKTVNKTDLYDFASVTKITGFTIINETT